MTTDPIPHDAVFAHHAAADPLDAVRAAAYAAGVRSAAYDMRPQHGGAVLVSDEATNAYLSDPATRSCLEEWLVAYRHDADTLAALPVSDRELVLESAWSGYEAGVRQARDAVRSAVTP